MAPLSLALAFNFATLLFALPLYERVSADPGLDRLLLLMVWVQALPTGLIFLVAAVMQRVPPLRRWLGLFWTALLVASLLSLVRLAQTKTGFLLAGTGDLPQPLRDATITALALALVAFATLFRRPLLRVTSLLAPLTLLVSAYFFIDTTAQTASGSPQPPDGRQGSGPARDDSVYIINFDEMGRDILLKNGSIDGQRFPNFKRLGDEAVWFSNATANYYFSCQAMPSLLSGRFVDGPSIGPDGTCPTPSLPDFRVLSTLARHYTISFYGTPDATCTNSPRFVCRDLSYLTASYPATALARHWLPEELRATPLSGWLGHFSRTYQWALFRDFLADVNASTAAGRVYVLHLLQPHAPYLYTAEGERHGSPYTAFRGDPEHDALVYRNYEQQTRLVDSLLGMFIDRLQAEGLYDRASIAITSDQGPRAPAGFVASPYAAGISRETPNVPLLIRSPRLKPSVSDIDYQHVDFVPTLLDLLGIEPLAPMAGVSALSPRRPVREKRFFWFDRLYVYQPETDLWAHVAGPNSP